MSDTAAVALPVVQPERCCQPGQCAYTPGRVRAILWLIRTARANGQDPGEAASAVFGSKGDGRSSGASAGSDTVRHATLVWDVQQAVRDLGGRPSAEAISARLCPYGWEDDEQ